MTLEGPRLTPFDRLRRRVLGATYTFHPELIPGYKAPLSTGAKAFFGILGAIAGGWLAGTPSGQSFIRRIRGR